MRRGVWYYALASWRDTPHVPPDVVAVTHHERSGHAGLVGGLLLACVVESIAVHILIKSTSEIFAWGLSMSTVYFGIWLIGDYRATVLHPILIRDDAIEIRAGFRGSLCIPRNRIRTITNVKPEQVSPVMNMTFMSTPSHWIEFVEPIAVQLPYGMRKQVRAVGVEPDEPKTFDAAVL